MISILRWSLVREEQVNLQKGKIENKRTRNLQSPFLSIRFLLPLVLPALDLLAVSTEDEVVLSTRQEEVGRPEGKK